MQVSADITLGEQLEFIQIVGANKKEISKVVGKFIREYILLNKHRRPRPGKQLTIEFP